MSGSIPGAGTRESELERLSREATTGEMLAIPYSDGDGGCYLKVDTMQIAAGLPDEDGAFIAALWNAYRSGELIAAADLSLSGGEEKGQGATQDGSGSQASPEAPSDPRPTGVDPSRGWRTIESVPLGEEVLLFGGRWPLTKGKRGRTVGFVDHLDSLQREDGSFYPSAPTHWAPLLPEPQALAGEARSAETQSGSVHEHAADLSATPEPLPLLSEQKHGEGRE